MNTIDALLNTEIRCSCGKSHRCDIKKVVLGASALNSMVSLIKDYSDILLVADTNTFAACGDSVKSMLIIAGKHLSECVYAGNSILIPDEKSILKLENAIHNKTELIIGIGTGVINDLCKYVSFQHDLPYIIVATAPSMDGFASTGAALIIQNMKVTYPAHAPFAIIADTRILKNAPFEMIQAGYGDMIGKYSALNDWALSHIITEEYYCPYVYDMVMQELNNIISLQDSLNKRDEAAIAQLMEGLVTVGIAMSFVNNSRPASGSEHHLSHFFEVTGILNNRPYFLHGIDVAYSTILTSLLREKLLKDGYQYSNFDYEQWKLEIERIFSFASQEVIALQNKLGWLDINRTDVISEKWPQIKSVLESSPSSKVIQENIEKMGLFYHDFEDHYGDVTVEESIRYAKYLKDRFTVLWLCHNL